MLSQKRKRPEGSGRKRSRLANKQEMLDVRPDRSGKARQRGGGSRGKPVPDADRVLPLHPGDGNRPAHGVLALQLNRRRQGCGRGRPDALVAGMYVPGPDLLHRRRCAGRRRRLDRLVAAGKITPQQRVVIFNTGAAQKYPEAIKEQLTHIDIRKPIDWGSI